MLTYLTRRLTIGVMTLLLVSFLIFALIRSIPGTPLTLDPANTDPNKAMSKENLEYLKKAYGLDKPWYEAYAIWLGNLVRGDLGNSFRERKPVWGVISQRVGPTLFLSLTSISLAFGLAIPIGLYCSAKSGQPSERVVSVILYMLYSLPSYVAGLLLLYVFYVYFQDTIWQLKPGMASDNYSELSPAGKAVDLLKHLILPLICFTYGGLAYDTRFVKANMEEALRQDYIRTARAKGVGPISVIWHHAFRNTLIPFVTLLGLTLPSLLSGAIILEQVFSWPGMGTLFLEALTFRDYPVIMGLTMMFSVLTLLGQLTADILYAFVDPRVTYN
jgi:peptide/nickel transport system permease protein